MNTRMLENDTEENNKAKLDLRTATAEAEKERFRRGTEGRRNVPFVSNKGKRFTKSSVTDRIKPDVEADFSSFCIAKKQQQHNQLYMSNLGSTKAGMSQMNATVSDNLGSIDVAAFDMHDSQMTSGPNCAFSKTA